MAATVPLRDRLSFLHRLPILLKGTSDDDVPCPGYLFEEIAKISHESLGSSQCLLEYLLSRLQSGSGRVKLKVLKIMLHLCGHGSSSFLLILKRNPAFIQEAAVFTGPPDPLHGNSLYQKVRAAAQDLGAALFSDALSPLPPSQLPRALPPAGMGSQSRPQTALQGFGYSKERGHTGSAGEAFLSTIQKAAEVVASAMRPGPESPSSQRSLLRGDAYQPAVTPSASLGPPTPGNPLPTAGPGARAMRHQPGQAGGGWDELDSSPNSQDSSQENDDLGKASDSGSPSGSDSPSGASGAPSDLAERVEAVTLSDCQQELSLVRAVTRGPHCFLSREEVQHFVKECGLLNCEAVLELLIRQLGATSERAQMRALGAIASLGRTDLLSQERVLLLARPRLQELSVGSPGPVTNKATKILRHFEASCRQWPPAQRPPAEPGPAVARVGLSDLLTDTLPFTGGQAFLQPLSSALFSPKGTAPPSGLQLGPMPPTSLDGCPLPAHADAREAKTRLAGFREQGAGSERGLFGTDTAKGGPELDPGPGDSCDSLFAGMELVACPHLVGAGTAAEEPLPACQDPWTSSQRVAAKEPSGSEPSAFAFLNS
ncbi:AP-4 complex accessory subunit tepsin isoform X1 [Physeter macrocephalus]|uniref:AP-4 complex accessory subunit Tepsin n=1 Tax=Physeter macrocephalus TaxID=9755 RepID=A0A2Y9T549_PHYMC|nr:AP-4 complex accessory subunit tepsin isoform X1 [Physeter catodon]|eukprot:XP_023986051.1 AP-4 complex accessory subunit tepsin isoform X1 [Physeter catodon]